MPRHAPFHAFRQKGEIIMTQSDSFDVLVIGGGPGGTPAAFALAMAGKKVLLAEAGKGLGGTCLFEGCIPSKIYRETAARRHEAARNPGFGLETDGQPPEVNWRKVIARRDKLLQMRSQGALMRAKAMPTLEVVFGRARLDGPRKAVIETAQGAREITFGKAILATGSAPNHLPIPGADLPGVLDSNSLIHIDHIPRSLTLIGGGPIGVEMAQIFSMLGAKTTILEAAPRILGPVDARLAALLTDQLRQDGIDVRTGVRVQGIRRENGGLVTSIEENGDAVEIASDTVAIAAGRHPAVDGLGLETTAVQHDRHGVKTNAFLETDEPGIYATGDLAGAPMFAHWATAQAKAVAMHILGRSAPYPRPEHNTAVIFSWPELGMAGLTEEAARERGMDVAVAEYDYKIDARAQISHDGLGRLRLVYRTDDKVVVGVHALIEGAAELMGEAALIVKNGLTLPQLAMAIHPHPTLTEAFGLAAAQALAGKETG